MLTGEFGIDVSDGAGTGFFDVKKRDWNRELIGLAGLPFEIFPHCMESTDLAGTVKMCIRDRLIFILFKPVGNFLIPPAG